jgi:hypothetical protein
LSKSGLGYGNDNKGEGLSESTTQFDGETVQFAKAIGEVFSQEIELLSGNLPISRPDNPVYEPESPVQALWILEELG